MTTWKLTSPNYPQPLIGLCSCQIYSLPARRSHRDKGTDSTIATSSSKVAHRSPTRHNSPYAGELAPRQDPVRLRRDLARHVARGGLVVPDRRQQRGEDLALDPVPQREGRTD